jgi:hypothetical protein
VGELVASRTHAEEAHPLEWLVYGGGFHVAIARSTGDYLVVDAAIAIATLEDRVPMAPKSVEKIHFFSLTKNNPC